MKKVLVFSFGLLLLLFIGFTASVCYAQTDTKPVIADNSSDLQVARAGGGSRYRAPSRPVARPTSGPAGGVTRRVTTRRYSSSSPRSSWFVIPFIGGGGGGGGIGCCGCGGLLGLIIFVLIILLIIKMFSKKNEPEPPADGYVEEVVEEYYEPPKKR